MGSQRATELYNQLRAAVAQPDVNHQHAKSLLAQLKIELSELGLLVPDSSSLDPGALTTARDVLEIGAFESLRTDDLAGFERYLSLLATYYNDLSSTLPRSSNEAPLFALSLLRLLSQNRIAEFHTLLETLGENKADVLESGEVSWVLQLERSLMEGSYSRVWSLCRPSSSSASLPLPEFSHFTPTLLQTVRNEIAACDERAYESLPVRDARTLLFLESDQEVQEFAQSRNWYLDPSTSTLHFPSSARHPSRLAPTQGIPAGGMTTGLIGGGGGFDDDSRELDRAKVVAATLKYARELESIV
ncbi:hypothetical protein C6P46_002749 [Rhodotorula mucilaginosa]|uniref:PCI domain-containing protein n=1 Tax=Rhodotorula mucilaginosa TaxID=5537 RepID=A0A9P6VSF3_RHOMI|nr:hypothetical protein C6P46_002749 [Rhodotorula mucilaginosa]TKA53284.1 hypothetical protein B0A53_04302 [Rhodotorula sp. CCFEE 5036]